MHTELLPYTFYPHDPPHTDLYTLALHDALPISHADQIIYNCRNSVLSNSGKKRFAAFFINRLGNETLGAESFLYQRFMKKAANRDRKSTRLNSQSRFDLVCRLLLEKKNKRIQ